MIKINLPVVGVTLRLLKQRNSDWYTLELEGANKNTRDVVKTIIDSSYGRYGLPMNGSAFYLPEDVEHVLIQEQIPYEVLAGSETIKRHDPPEGALP